MAVRSKTLADAARTSSGSFVHVYTVPDGFVTIVKSIHLMDDQSTPQTNGLFIVGGSGALVPLHVVNVGSSTFDPGWFGWVALTAGLELKQYSTGGNSSWFVTGAELDLTP